MRTPRPRPSRSSDSPAPFLAALIALLGACGGGGDKGPSEAEVIARDRASAHFAVTEYEKAREALAPLLAKKQPLAEDLLRAASIELAVHEYGKARDYVERALKALPESPTAHYLRGRILEQQDFLQMEQAIAEYRRALELAPGNVPATACLGRALAALDHTEEAELHLQAILDLGLEQAGGYYRLALAQMKSLRIATGRDAQELIAREQEVSGLGVLAPREEEIDVGLGAGVPPARPIGTGVAAQGGWPEYRLAATLLPELAGATRLEAHDFDGNRELDLVASGPFGLAVAMKDFYDVDPQRDFFVLSLATEPVEAFACFDLGNDDDLDIVASVGGQLRYYEARDEAIESLNLDRTAFHPVDLGRLGLPSPARAILPVDYDHDGDLDLCLVGDFGVRLLRCDGAAATKEEKIDAAFEGGFTDATGESGLPELHGLAWVVSEDYDADQDVDLLLGGAGVLHLASNLRGGRFEDGTRATFGEAAPFAGEPLVADLDGDGRTDVLAPGSPARLWNHARDGAWKIGTIALAFPADRGAPIGVDIDLNGDLDLLWRGGDGLCEGVLSVATERELPGRIAGSAGSGSLCLADFDRDLRYEILRASSAGIEVWDSESPVGKASLQQWFGKKDNRQGVGAIVEERAGPIYRRIYWRGDPVLVGVGERDLIDVVRILWPNGVLQQKARWECGKQLDIQAVEQPTGLIGSCPFLYTWNGTTHTFVSDVLGITPLGLPMAPGMLVPPDHDEYVLVRGDQLVPKDGAFELQFTEELREVTYLDALHLQAVDHPAGTEIFPDERFTFPPFPAPHTHSVRDPLAPRRVTGSDGQDWTEALARTDDVHAVPFEPLPDQFLGLANEHWLELEFERERVAAAPKLRLVLTGWFYWTDASVNMASARTPHVRFEPPLIAVPRDGEWQPIGPPVGFPAGKTKTMVIDLTDVLNREDPRLRIASTLRLYWDRIALAVDNDDADLRVFRMEAQSARLWRRGFSAAVPGEADEPERFSWGVLADLPRWNQHPGMYTRYGETQPLVQAIDDCFVVMGAGDALTVRFDARYLAPPPEGYVRDYLVFLDGWAKDRDPNTLSAETVEPLPFHAMSGYPYGPDEHFPDDELHRRWREEYQTRPAEDWIEPLAPARRHEQAQPVEAAAPR